MMSSVIELSVPIEGPYDLAASLRTHRFGPTDPTSRLTRDSYAKATRTPEGDATLLVKRIGDVLAIEIHGDGGRWLEGRLDRILGLADEPWTFRPDHSRLKWHARDHAGARLSLAPNVFDVHVAAIFQQRVTFESAMDAYKRLLFRFGEPAPGPVTLRLPLTPKQWLRVPADLMRSVSLESKRIGALRIAAEASTQLALLGEDPAAVDAYLSTLPGTGVWTTQTVLGNGLGYPDAVPIGDAHLPDVVRRFFDGVPWGDDARMVALLEPFRGHRYRVLRILSSPQRPRSSIGRAPLP